MDFPRRLFSLYTPGVSRNASWESSNVFTPSILFLVVLGLFETAETFSPTMEFTRVDLPTLGLPTTEMKPDLKFLSEPLPDMVRAVTVLQHGGRGYMILLDSALKRDLGHLRVRRAAWTPEYLLFLLRTCPRRKAPSLLCGGREPLSQCLHNLRPMSRDKRRHRNLLLCISRRKRDSCGRHPLALRVFPYILWQYGGYSTDGRKKNPQWTGPGSESQGDGYIKLALPVRTKVHTRSRVARPRK